MSNLLSSLHLARGTRVMVLALSALVGCAEAEEKLEELFADAGQPPVVDSSIPWTPAPDAGYVPYDAGQSNDSGAILPVDAGLDSSSPGSDAGRPDAGPG